MGCVARVQNGAEQGALWAARQAGDVRSEAGQERQRGAVQAINTVGAWSRVGSERAEGAGKPGKRGAGKKEGRDEARACRGRVMAMTAPQSQPASFIKLREESQVQKGAVEG